MPRNAAAIGDALRSAARRVAGQPRLRAAVLRLLLREDEIVPFGRSLAFDPHSWVIKQTEYGFRIWVALGERSISREIMLDRYEREEVAFVRATVRAGDRVVDVGANIGFYTALLAALVGPAGEVIACEPLETVADALERTIAENGFAERVTLHRVALDAQAGTVSLRHAPVTINAGAAYLAPAAALPAGHVDAPVRAQTLDDVVGSGACAFVKLDAEGAEPRILAGAARTLARCRPVLLAEFNPTLLARVGSQHAGDVIALMAAHGYTARRLRDGIPADVLERYDDSANINVVFRTESTA
ncbi:MAG: FkbM family methyltransferase [Candidatus Velthaea sp.]|jgi:FkbM family methyltransferase